MSLKENSCKNFVPNVFNKNKCLNCFKSRDTHLKSDKDLSKVSWYYLNMSVPVLKYCLLLKFNAFCYFYFAILINKIYISHKFCILNLYVVFMHV